MLRSARLSYSNTRDIMSLKSHSRRSFLKKVAAGTGVAFVAPAGAYGRIMGANDRVALAAIGINSRGAAVAGSFARVPNLDITHVVDVDSRALEKVVDRVARTQGHTPKAVEDFRRVLDDPAVDAVMIATPDHWHAPMAIMALQAGKHVYVEKPCGHNPREGELLVEAQRKTGKVVQMGTQQRSAPESIQAIGEIGSGVIGRPYFARTWYANKRGPIGIGKPAPVPDWLNYELWQGPAPRRPYQDNLIHYNWHWFWNWGTGESCNNATHEVDFSRWALGVDYPTRVTSGGGRFHYNDDWEFYDTQVMTFEFGNESAITWDGRSCNGLPVYDRGRGAVIHGTEGSILIDRDGYIQYDLGGKEVRRVMTGARSDGTNTVGEDILTDYHAQNFVNGIVKGEALNAPITEGHKSVLLCHLGNIAQKVGRTLDIDPATGHIKNDPEAVKLWSRDYEPGWAPVV